MRIFAEIFNVTETEFRLAALDFVRVRALNNGAIDKNGFESFCRSVGVNSGRRQQRAFDFRVAQREIRSRGIFKTGFVTAAFDSAVAARAQLDAIIRVGRFVNARVCGGVFDDRFVFNIYVEFKLEILFYLVFILRLVERRGDFRALCRASDVCAKASFAEMNPQIKNTIRTKA
ncbi:MAG: hypothetical protein M3384_02435 [Acidobacteriota bacterium]|nr:hypothetical protein [Acidobacteriota bacterium]